MSAQTDMIGRTQTDMISRTRTDMISRICANAVRAERSETGVTA